MFLLSIFQKSGGVFKKKENVFGGVFEGGMDKYLQIGAMTLRTATQILIL